MVRKGYCSVACVLNCGVWGYRDESGAITRWIQASPDDYYPPQAHYVMANGCNARAPVKHEVAGVVDLDVAEHRVWRSVVWGEAGWGRLYFWPR